MRECLQGNVYSNELNIVGPYISPKYFVSLFSNYIPNEILPGAKDG